MNGHEARDKRTHGIFQHFRNSRLPINTLIWIRNKGYLAIFQILAMFFNKTTLDSGR
jgi:hypothetical protein